MVSTVAAEAGVAATATSVPPTITAAATAAHIRDHHPRLRGAGPETSPMATMILLQQ
uniref:Uncharacterized protein n=1 Tax=Verrucosispora sp. MS100047 TaxID=1410949 RepID=A0A097CRG9_9ACTN|nr:hypothetical protein VASRM7_22 [Verrucosispora sp. MS100047]